MKIFKLVSIFALFVVSVLCFNSVLSAAGLTTAALVFTAPGGVATPFFFDLTYMPQFLTWNNVVPLTSLKIETKEDGVIQDLLAASIAVINGYMTLGQQATNIVTLRLANGQISGKRVRISGVTSAAGAIGFYEASDCLGTNLFKITTANILSRVPMMVDDFLACWVPAMAATTDICDIEYRNGHRQSYNINDLSALSSYYQEVPAIMVNNIDQKVKNAKFTCVAASTPAYILSVIR